MDISFKVKHGIFVRLFLAVFILAFAFQNAYAYTSTIGGEFMVYPLDTWGRGDSPFNTPVASNDIATVVSITSYENDTVLNVTAVQDDGSEVVVYTGTLKAFQVVDLYDAYDADTGGNITYPGRGPPDTESPIHHKWVHIISSHPVNVYVASAAYNGSGSGAQGYGGTYRVPPGKNGRFLDNQFIIHYPWHRDNSPAFGITNGGHYPVFGVFYWENNSINVTIQYYNENGTAGDDGNPNGDGTGTYKCELTGNGNPDEPAFCTFSYMWDDRPLTYVITALGHGDIHVLQYNKHVDTMSWAGNIDTGLLLGKTAIFMERDGTNGLADVFNPNNESVIIDLCVLTTGGGGRTRAWNQIRYQIN